MSLFCVVALVYGKIAPPGERQNGKSVKQIMLETNQIPRQPSLDNDQADFCTSCKDMVAEVKDALADPTKLDELKNRVKTLCGYTGVYAQSCRMLAENLPFLVHEISPYLDQPEAVCAKLKLCGTDRTTAAVHKLLLLYVGKKFDELAPPAVFDSRRNDIICDECQFAITTLKSYLTTQTIKDKVKAYLYGLCTKLGSAQQECENLMDQYLPLLFQELEALLNDPHGVCSEAGLCSNSFSDAILVRGAPTFRAHKIGKIALMKAMSTRKLELFRTVLSKLRTRSGINVGCTVCEASFRTVVRMLESDKKALNSTVEVVKKICDLFPDEIKPQCDDFLDQYGISSLIVAIDQIDPEKICVDLTACKANDVLMLRRITGRVKQDVECESCQAFFQAVEYELKDPGTIEELKSLVKRVCSLIPPRFLPESECDSYADELTVTVVSLLNSMSADTICKGISMCPSNTNKIH